MSGRILAALLCVLSSPAHWYDPDNLFDDAKKIVSGIVAEILAAVAAIFIFRTIEFLHRERRKISAWWNRLKSGRKLILLWLDADVATVRKLANKLKSNLPHVRIRVLKAPGEIIFYPLRKSVIQAVILISTDVTKLSSEDVIRAEIEERVKTYVLDGGGLVAGHDIIYRRTRNTELTKAFGVESLKFSRRSRPVKYLKTTTGASHPIGRSLPDNFTLDDGEAFTVTWAHDAQVLFEETGVENPAPALVMTRTYGNGRLVWLNSCDREESGLAGSISDPSKEFVRLLTASVQWAARLKPSPLGAPLIGAHRGVKTSEGDNTMSAFQEAVRQGADFIETDIRRTKDGVLVLRHDEKIGFAFIAETPFADLQRIASTPTVNCPLTTLEQLLELAVTSHIMLDLELKETGYENAIATMIKKHQLRVDHFVVTSFLEEAIRQFKTCYNESTCGLLIGKKQSWWREWFPVLRLKRCGADFVAANESLLRLWFARRMDRKKYPVWVWTVNNPARIARLLRTVGVEAVITDLLDTAKTEQANARSS